MSCLWGYWFSMMAIALAGFRDAGGILWHNEKRCNFRLNVPCYQRVSRDHGISGQLLNWSYRMLDVCNGECMCLICGYMWCFLRVCTRSALISVSEASIKIQYSEENKLWEITWLIWWLTQICIPSGSVTVWQVCYTKSGDDLTSECPPCHWYTHVQFSIYLRRGGLWYIKSSIKF